MNFLLKTLSYYFTNYLMILQSINVIFIIFLFAWLSEWLYFFDYILNFSTSLYIIFPNKIALLLLVCLVFWLYVWGVSVWRRTQFGRFTRGDRKLWLKGFASFWVVEVITLMGLLLVSCWMSWGPIVIIPRHFWFPKKGFLFELTLFTYIMWLVYLMRFSLKWQLWRTQFFITLVIILILFLLIWRDLITLMFRELVSMDTGTNWRYRKSSSIVYSISSIWWLECYMGHHYRDNFSYYSPIEIMLKNLYSHTYAHPFKLENVSNMKEYDWYTWLPISTQSYWWDHIGMEFNLFDRSLQGQHLYLLSDPVNCIFPPYRLANSLHIYDVGNSMISNNYTNYSGFFYPRRVGFLPKRIAMWYFLVIIKMWHHFMLFIWWFFYLLRLYNRRKSSYTMLSACYFNLYCCYIIGFLVYLYHVLPFLSTFMRYRPYIQSIFHWYAIFFEAINFVIFSFFGELLIFKDDHFTLKEMFYSEVFKNESHICHLDVLRRKAYLNSMSDFTWSNSLTHRSANKRLAAVFSDVIGITWINKNLFDASIDVYTYGLFSPKINLASNLKSNIDTVLDSTLVQSVDKCWFSGFNLKSSL